MSSDPPLPPLPSPPLLRRTPPPFSTLAPSQLQHHQHHQKKKRHRHHQRRSQSQSQSESASGGGVSGAPRTRTRARPLPPLPPLPPGASPPPFVTLRPSSSSSSELQPQSQQQPAISSPYVTLPPARTRGARRTHRTRRRRLPLPPSSSLPTPPKPKPKPDIELSCSELFQCISRECIVRELMGTGGTGGTGRGGTRTGRDIDIQVGRKALKLPFRMDSGQLRGMAVDFVARFVGKGAQPQQHSQRDGLSDDSESEEDEDPEAEEIYDDLIGINKKDVLVSRRQMKLGKIRYGLGDESKSVEIWVFRLWDIVTNREKDMPPEVVLRWARFVANCVCLLIRVSERRFGWTEKNVLRKKEEEEEDIEVKTETGPGIEVDLSGGGGASRRLSMRIVKKKKNRFIGDSDDEGADAHVFDGIVSSSSSSEELLPDEIEEERGEFSVESDSDSDSDSDSSEGEIITAVPVFAGLGFDADSETEEEDDDEVNVFDFFTDSDQDDDVKEETHNKPTTLLQPVPDEDEEFESETESESEGEIEIHKEDIGGDVDSIVADAEVEFGSVIDALDLDLNLDDDDYYEEGDTSEEEEEEGEEDIVLFHKGGGGLLVESPEEEGEVEVVELGVSDYSEDEDEGVVVDIGFVPYDIVDDDDDLPMMDSEELEFEEEELDGEGPGDDGGGGTGDLLDFGFGVEGDDDYPQPQPRRHQTEDGAVSDSDSDDEVVERFPVVVQSTRPTSKKKKTPARSDSSEGFLDRSQFEALVKKRFKQFFTTFTPGSAGSGRDRFSILVSDILGLSLGTTEDEEEIAKRTSFKMPAFPLFTTIYVIILQPVLRGVYFDGSLEEDVLRDVLPVLKPLEVACHLTRSHRKLCILQCLFKYYMRIDEASHKDLVLDGDEDDDEIEEESALVRLERTMEYILEDFRSKKKKEQALSRHEENHLLSVLSVMLATLGRELGDYVDTFENDYVLLGNRLRVYSASLKVWVAYAEEGTSFKDLFMSNLRKISLHATRSHFARLRKDVLSGKLRVAGQNADVDSTDDDDGVDYDDEDVNFSDDEDEVDAKLQKKILLRLTRYSALIDLVISDIRAEAIGVKKAFGSVFENDTQVVTCYLNLLVDDVGKHLGTLQELEEEHLKFFEKLKEFVVFAVMVHKKIDPDTSFQTGDLLSRWEGSVQKLIDNWFAKIQDLFYSYTERSIKVETWRPVAAGKMFSSSVLDVFTYLRQSSQFLYNICIPSIKRYFFAYAQLCAGLVQKYAVMVLEGLPEGVASLSPHVAPLRDIKLRVRLQRMFRGGKKFDARLAEYQQSEHDRLKAGRQFPYESLYVRYNDLFYALVQFVRLLDEMQKAWARLNRDTHVDPEGGEIKTRLDQMTTATGMILKEHMKGLAEFIAARNVYYELNDVIFVELYNVEIVDNSLQSFIPKYFEPLVEDMEMNLIDERLSQPILISVFRYLIAALTLVIVDGGELRKFGIRDHSRLARDLDQIGQFFRRRCGVSQSIVDSASSKLRTLITKVMSKTSQQLVDGVRGQNLPYSDLPTKCDGMSPWCKGTVYKVLYHRDDEVSQRFLKGHTYHYTQLWL